jgi:hypothetical protein
MTHTLIYPKTSYVDIGTDYRTIKACGKIPRSGEKIEVCGITSLHRHRDNDYFCALQWLS